MTTPRPLFSLRIMTLTIVLSLSSLAHAIDVTTTKDIVDSSDDVTSLREALASIPSKNTTSVDVNLTIAGTYYLTKPLKDEVKYKSFTLKGLGASTTIISRSYNDTLESMFQLYGSTSSSDPDIQVTMDGLSITNGYSKFGGAISSDYVSLTLRNCILSNNKALDSGGAITFDSSSYESRTLTIENCALRNNTAGASGGAIDTSYGTATIRTSVFDNNNSLASGGAMRSYYSTVAIDQTTFVDNIATYSGYQTYGGALNINYARAMINNSTFFRNRVDGTSSSSIYGGGALGVSGGQQITVTNTTFSQNYSFTSGGAIYNNSNSPMILRNVTISENQAYRGGGFYQYGSSPDAILYNSIISGNKASYAGNDCYGVVNSEGYNLITDITNCTITGNDDQTDQYQVSADLSSYIDFSAPGSGHYELEITSPAIDGGDPAPADQGGTCVRPDQLGNPQAGKACDIGSVESTLLSACTSGNNDPSTDCDGDGLSEDKGDCNDADAATYCGATESINGKDDNCDGLIDDKTVVGSTGTDDDGDGFAENQGDCNDTNPSMYPGAPNQLSNGSDGGIDYDCDCIVNEGPSCESSADSASRATDLMLAAPAVSADTAKIVKAFVARNLKDAQTALAGDIGLQRTGVVLAALWQEALRANTGDISPLLGKTGHWLMNLSLKPQSAELHTLGGFMLKEAGRPVTVAGFTKDLRDYLTQGSQRKGFYFLGQKLF